MRRYEQITTSKFVCVKISIQGFGLYRLIAVHLSLDRNVYIVQMTNAKSVTIFLSTHAHRPTVRCFRKVKVDLFAGTTGRNVLCKQKCICYKSNVMYREMPRQLDVSHPFLKPILPQRRKTVGYKKMDIWAQESRDKGRVTPVKLNYWTYS